MNHLIPSRRFALPFILLLTTLLAGCGGGSIRSSVPDEQTTMYLSQDTAVDFSVTGTTGDALHYGWDIIQYDGNNQQISIRNLPGTSELTRRHTFTASDLSNFRTEVRATLYRQISSGGWPVNLPLDSVTWEISKPVEKVGTQIPSSLFLRNPNDLPNLSDISAVTGHVILDDTRFRDAAPLNSLTHIGGDLVVNRSLIRTAKDLHLNPALVLDGGLHVRNNLSLTSLTGLESVSQLGELIIESNRLLKDLTGLGGLERIDGNLLVKDNIALISTKGVEALQNVQIDVSLLSNPALASLEGFAGLTQIGGIFAIDFNSGSYKDPSRLANLSGLDALTHVGSININANSRLESLQGLNQLTTVAHYIHLADNPQLANLRALENLSSVGTVSLLHNPRLRNLQGLEQVRALEYLIIAGSYDNMPPTADGLTSLSGIEAVGSIRHLLVSGSPLLDLSALGNVSITGSLNLSRNLITRLDGLNNVTRLDSLSLIGNDQLTDLSGLSALARVDGGLSIAFNQSLCQAAADALVAQVQNAGGVGGAINVGNNNGCN